MRRPSIALVLALAIAAYVYLKNAWVAEDAYIVFRSLEQLFAGHGPVWNPHERVQVFTSPLWYFLLAGFRLFSANHFLNAIVAGGACWLAALFVLRRVLNDDHLLLAGVLMMTASNGFYDFTGSGLEYPLAYLVIALYLLSLTRPKEDGRATRGLLLCLGAALCVRLDLVSLLLPGALYVLFENGPGWSRRRRLGELALALTPPALWTAFSLVYYGFPFPNSAYAKLNTGIPRADLVHQGLLYLETSFRRDTITMPVILAAVAVVFLRPASGRLRALAVGLLLNLLYVIAVGGDFMQGRFLACAYLVALVVLLLRFGPGGIPTTAPRRMAGVAVLAIYLIMYPHTPFGSPLNHTNIELLHGVADERGFYFHDLSLVAWLDRGPEQEFPDHLFADGGRRLLAGADTVAIEGRTGMYGYCAGIEKIVIDPLALTDPLLARLPVKGDWRPGHYERAVPEGYRQRRVDGSTALADPRLDAYYGKLQILTQQKPLLSSERLGVILRFNLGVYDDLVRPEEGG